jgi:hypothetical protein
MGIPIPSHRGIEHVVVGFCVHGVVSLGTILLAENDRRFYSTNPPSTWITWPVI